MNLKSNNVKQLYEKYPYPNRIHYDTFESFFRGIGITKEDIKGKEVLDAGCGTGEDSCMFAHFGANVTAFFGKKLPYNFITKILVQLVWIPMRREGFVICGRKGEVK